MILQEAQRIWWNNVQNNLDRLKRIWPDISDVKNLDELATFYGKNISAEYEERFRLCLDIPRKT